MGKACIVRFLIASVCSLGAQACAANGYHAPTAGRSVILAHAVNSPNQALGNKVSGSRLIRYRAYNYKSEDGSTTIYDLAIDPARARIRVIDVLRLPVKPNAFRILSLAETRSVTNALLVAEVGARYTYPEPVPLGLVIADGRVTNPITYEKDQYGRIAFSGALCVQGDAVRIIRLPNQHVAQCHDAAQSGPVLIAPGGVMGIRPGELTTSRMAISVIAIDGAGRVHFLISPSAHLYDIASFALHDLGAVSAMFLGINAGLLTSDAHYGNVYAAIPTAVAVFPR